MRRMLLYFLLTAAMSLAGAGAVCAHGGHAGPDPKGEALLLVTFGTSVPKAQKAFVNIEKQMRAAFPDMEIRWAYTSHIIRKKLAGQGKQIDSPEMALAKLMDEGYQHVTMQSLHMIPGAEFHEIFSNAQAFAGMHGGIENIRTGYPLLVDNPSMDEVLDAVFTHIVPKDRRDEDAVVLMGHGTHHPSDALYSAMMYKAQVKDPNCYVGTVEGFPTFEEVLAQLQAKGTKKAYLIPLMTVAGDHSINDMASDEPDSWKSQLKKAGIEAVPVMQGLAENESIVAIWIKRLKAGKNGHGHAHPHE